MNEVKIASRRWGPRLPYAASNRQTRKRLADICASRSAHVLGESEDVPPPDFTAENAQGICGPSY